MILESGRFLNRVRRASRRLRKRSPRRCWSPLDWILQNGIRPAPELFHVGAAFDRTVSDQWPEAVRTALDPHKRGRSFDRYLTMLPQTTLHRVSGAIELSDGTFLWQTSWNEEDLKRNPCYSLRWQGAPRQMSGRFFPLLQRWTTAHFHWMLDVLPRLHGVVERIPEDVQFIVPEDTAPYQYSTLILAGINRSRILPFTGRRPWLLEECWYSPPAAQTGDYDTEALSWVREVLQPLTLERAGCETGRPKKIYISRSLARCRRVVNEDAVLTVLSKFGIEPVCLEQRTIGEQLSLIAGADLVVAPHGAGLANLVCAAPGTRVIEFFEPFAIRHCYWALANALGLSYSCLLAESVRSGTGEPDMRVPVDELSRLLSAAS